MREIFEEMVSRRLPSLYAGARFLAAGVDAQAEDLLASALDIAFSRYTTWAWDQSGLERAMVDELLDRWRLGLPPARDGGTETPPQETGPTPPALGQEVTRVLASLDGESLYRAARELPPRARTAIWLVSLEKWSYEKAGAALSVDRNELQSLLAWRQVLLEELLATSSEPRSARGSI